MRDVCLLDETFQLREIPLEQLDHFGFENKFTEVVTLRADEMVLDQMTAYFGDENIKPDGTGYYTVIAHLPVEEDTARFLIGFCNHCACLGPESMRTLIKRLLKQTLRLYD
jgi:predicted DNA-binding transcriptional regulator YafY